MTPLDRCLAYVDKMPAAMSGQGGHNATFAVACECVRFGLDDADAATVLNWYNANRCTPPWTSKDLAHKLKSARQNTSSEAGVRLREDRQQPDNSRGHAIPFDGVIGRGDEAPIEPPVLGRRPNWETADLREFLQALFQPGELVSYNVNWQLNEEGKKIPRGWGVRGRPLEHLLADDGPAESVVSADPEAGAWVRLNPMDGQGISDTNVKDYRHVLVESDEMPVEAQLALMHRLHLPCSAIVHSGVKSVHAAVRIDAGQDIDLYRDRVARLYDLLDQHGLKVDGQNKNPSRLSRLPGVRRGGAEQYLVATHTGARSWADFEALQRSAETPAGEFASLTGWQALAEQPIPWVFDGAIPDLTVTVMGAQGGLGKSMFVTGLALSAVLGRSLFPSFRIEAPVPVVFLAGEDSVPIICRRIRSYVSAHELDPEAVTDALTSRLFLQAMQAHPMLEMSKSRTLEPTPFYARLLEQVKAKSAKLVIIDTSRKFGGIVNEIDNAQVGAFMEACAQLALQAKCGVIVLHHSSKIAADEKSAKQTDLRGGSAFGDEARAVWVMKRRRDKRVELSNQKLSYHRTHEPVVLDFCEGGALIEAEKKRSENSQQVGEEDAKQVFAAIRSWIKNNPEKPIGQREVSKRDMDKAGDFYRHITGMYPWVQWKQIAEIISRAMSANALDEGSVRIGKSTKKSIILGVNETW